MDVEVIANPAKEAVNRRKHLHDFSRVAEILSGPVIDYWDDRPLGYEQEGRVRLLGLLDDHVVVLVFEPVELDDGSMAVRPISLRNATRREERDFWDARA